MMNSEDEKIILQQNIEYAYQIFRLIVYAIIATYFTGCLWYIFVNIIQEQYNNEKEKMQFFNHYFNIDEDDLSLKVIKSCYFMLTTLSTVGYGDFYPVNMIERSVSFPIMLAGVAFFSYIMGHFIDIISNYDKKMGVIDKSSDLFEWLDTLQHYNIYVKQHTGVIETHFSYYWQNDRLAFFNIQDDFLLPLP